MPNLYGDIVSDLCAGPGRRARRRARRQPRSRIGGVRGRARQRAGHRRQEPGQPHGAAAVGAADAATIWARPPARRSIQRALEGVLAGGAVRTRDLGGTRDDLGVHRRGVRGHRSRSLSDRERATRPADDITRAVLARDEVVAYLNGSHGESGPRAEERDPRVSRGAAHPAAACRSTARSSIRFTRSSARSRGITENEAIVRRATAQGRVVYVSNHRSHIDYLIEPLVLEDNEHPAAGDRRGHQPVRRPARPDPQARDRRDSDPAQRQRTRLPDHAQGLHRRDPRPPRPDVLHRGRTQLQRRDEVAEDRPRPRRAAGRSDRISSFCRAPCPTTSCSKTSSSRIRK